MNKSAILICVIIGVALGVYGYLRWASVLKVKQSGTSMVPTIMPGEVVAVDRGVYRLTSPKRFDLVAFRHFQDSNSMVIFRIVGMPGETVQLQSGKVSIDGKILSLPANMRTLPLGVGAFGSSNVYAIPKRHYYLLGDNGTNASDSRFWGAVKEEDVIGKAYVLK